MKHISDGPRGGIWVLAKGKGEVLTCVLDELEELRLQRISTGKFEEPGLGGCQVLGLGAKIWEGSIFFIHPCGPGGPPIDEEQGKVGPRRKKGPIRLVAEGDSQDNIDRCMAFERDSGSR